MTQHLFVFRRELLSDFISNEVDDTYRLSEVADRRAKEGPHRGMVPRGVAQPGVLTEVCEDTKPLADSPKAGAVQEVDGVHDLLKHRVDLATLGHATADFAQPGDARPQPVDLPRLWKVSTR